MPLSKEQRDASECTLQACGRVGLYAGLNLSVDAFRARPCHELVDACEKTCPLTPADYNTRLITFREAVRSSLTAKGYTTMRIMLGYLCMVEEDGDRNETPWTWGDWCDYLAQTLA
jgi:hypothetical protein